MKKERLVYLDLIRIIAMVFVVCNHFCAHFAQFEIIGYNKIFYRFINGDFGFVGVTLFFMVSGASLMHIYKDNLEIKKFYKKRLLAIFPMFYIAYFIAFMINFLVQRHLPEVPATHIIFTFLGMDGYLSNYTTMFYLIGEWFLGAIILIYILFPILRIIMKKYSIISLIVLGCINFAVLLLNPFKMDANHTIMVCVFSVCLGMFIGDYINKINTKVFIISIILTILMLLVNINFDNMMLTSNVFGYLLFFDLIFISKFINNNSIKNILEKIAKYIYPVFLVQHQVILYVENYFYKTTLSVIESICLLIMCISMIIILAKGLYYITNKIMNVFQNN